MMLHFKQDFFQKTPHKFLQQMTETPAIPCKLVVVGPGGSGKTCLLIRLAQDTFPEDYLPTVFDNHVAKINFGNGITFDMGLWDTMARSEEGERIPSGFNDLREAIVGKYLLWIEEMKFDRSKVIVLGTKCDLRDKESDFKTMYLKKPEKIYKTSKEDNEMFFSKLGLQYMECSAKTNYNIKTLLHTIALTHFESTMHSKKKPSVFYHLKSWFGIEQKKEKSNETIVFDLKRQLQKLESGA